MTMPQNEIAERIRHVLSIYPRISHSMLQIGLTGSIPAKDWRPVLEVMIAECEVQVDNEQHETPTGRYQSYSIVSLTPTKENS